MNDIKKKVGWQPELMLVYKLLSLTAFYISRPYLLAGKIKIMVISDTTTNYTSAACSCFDECTSLILFMII